MNKGSRHILVCECHDDGRFTIDELLQAAGYVVTSIRDTTDLFTAMESEDINLVLFHFRSVLSSRHLEIVSDCQPAISGVPAAVMAPVSDIASYIDFFSLGFHHFIYSPCTMKYLDNRIARILRIEEETEAELTGKCEIVFKGDENSLSLDNAAFSELFFSTFENFVSHSREITNTISRIKRHGRSSKHDDIIGDDDFFSVKDSKLEGELTRALKNSRFRLHYQPVISIHDTRLVGFESLIRWDHEERGLIMPDEFMPTLESSPLIIAAGFWIIEEAARQMSEWKMKFSQQLPLSINVNLSAKQFTHTELDIEIERILAKYSVEPGEISFEITESAFMYDMESANLMLLKLKKNEHLIYMDDFGTGYSSLSYLQHFPVDRLKIDKSFVQWMHLDEQSRLIVKTVIDLSHNLNMKVVAEGVEEREHELILSDFNCDFGQGYYYSKPMNSDEVETCFSSF